MSSIQIHKIYFSFQITYFEIKESSNLDLPLTMLQFFLNYLENYNLLLFYLLFYYFFQSISTQKDQRYPYQGQSIENLKFSYLLKFHLNIKNTIILISFLVFFYRNTRNNNILLISKFILYYLNLRRFFLFYIKLSFILLITSFETFFLRFKCRILIWNIYNFLLAIRHNTDCNLIILYTFSVFGLFST